MKIRLNNNCPQCGAKNFEIVENDLLVCEYCGHKIDYKLDEIDFSNEDIEDREKTKQECCKKIAELNACKSFFYSKLLHFTRKRTSRMMSTVALIIMICTIFVCIASLVAERRCVSLIVSAVVSVLFYTTTLILNGVRYKKYTPIVEDLAFKVAFLEKQLDFYAKIKRKLTK